MKRILPFAFLFSALFAFPQITKAQWPVLNNGKSLNPSDPTRPYSGISFSGELLNLVKGNLWQFTLSGAVAFAKNTQEIAIELPYVRSEYTGIESLSGIGDVSVSYLVMTYESKQHVRTLSSSALKLNLSLPTGNEFDGHGAGVPVFTPEFVLAYRPVKELAIYPDFRYVHSIGISSSNWAGGFPGVIPEDPASDSRKIRVIQTELLFNLEFNEAWVGIAPSYTYDLKGNEGTLTISPELGKMFTEKFSLNLGAAFYVAGRQRLINRTMFELNYFF